MLSSMSMTVFPIGYSAMYIPVASIVRVNVFPSLLVITTSTPSIAPGRPRILLAIVVDIFEHGTLDLATWLRNLCSRR